MPIDTVAEVIRLTGRLPGFPLEEEMVASGIPVAEVTVKLVEKIEEITLHLIQLKRENETLRLRLEELESSLLYETHQNFGDAGFPFSRSRLLSCADDGLFINGRSSSLRRARSALEARETNKGSRSRIDHALECSKRSHYQYQVRFVRGAIHGQGRGHRINRHSARRSG